MASDQCFQFLDGQIFFETLSLCIQNGYFTFYGIICEHLERLDKGSVIYDCNKAGSGQIM